MALKMAYVMIEQIQYPIHYKKKMGITSGGKTFKVKYNLKAATTGELVA